MVIHVNHPQELDEHVLASTDRLIDRGIPVLNQAVLLKGVNDHVDILADLCRKLVESSHRALLRSSTGSTSSRCGPLSIRGTGNSRGERVLMQQLRKRLPGYAVPTYVAEEPGQESKTVL